MQAENIEEYRIVRDELLQLKGCITTYVGWVFGGAGAGFLAIAYASRDLATHAIAISFAALSIAFVLSLVLLIICYKFISHNRYAGYCKLLTQERYRVPPKASAKPGAPIFAWEVCMDRLRQSDFRNTGLIEVARSLQVGGVDSAKLVRAAERLTGPSPPADVGNTEKGLWIILRALSGHVTSTSWPFPVYVVSLFAVLVWAYVMVSFYLLIAPGAARADVHQWLLYGLFVVVLAYLWRRFCQRVFNLMEGSRSLDAYCWKCLLVRREFLDEVGIRKAYRLVGLNLLTLRGDPLATSNVHGAGAGKEAAAHGAGG